MPVVSLACRWYALTHVKCKGCLRHNVKIVLGTFNARVGTEAIFGTTVGKFCFHNETASSEFGGSRYACLLYQIPV